LKPVEILIYDDNRDLRQGLERLIESTRDFKLAGSFADCLSVEAQVKNCSLR
jgi:hypothetical protein